MENTLSWGWDWFFLFLPDSIILLVWALSLQFAYFLRLGSRDGQPGYYLLGLCLLGLVSGFFLIQETLNWILVGGVLVFSVAVRVILPYRSLLIQSLRATLIAHLAFVVVILLLLGSISLENKTNHLGLVSFEPNSEYEYDFSDNPNKDNYPVCRFKNNSLGFRDREPGAGPHDRETILIVGDSYIWGDGIPGNEQTIGALLRERLEQTEPGKFEVISAAYPGNGIYGYSRFITSLEPHFHPAVVVIGYLGLADFDPVDAQFLMDYLPENKFWRNLAVNIRFLQDVRNRPSHPVLKDPHQVCFS